MPILQPKGDREYVYTVFRGAVREHVLVRENSKSFLVKKNSRKNANRNFRKEGVHEWYANIFANQFITTRNHTTAIIFAQFQCRFCGFNLSYTPSKHRRMK